MRTPAELVEVFRAQGLKVTPQRQCIFRLLDGNGVHPTAESVYAAAREEMPTISLKTVYQTLNDLAEMGEIQQLDLGTGSSRFDPNVEAHHHLVCSRCGKVRDLFVRADVDLPEDQLAGFVPAVTEVVVRGLCADCLPSSASPTQPHEETTHA